jgi:hypothetical protein
MPHSWVRINLAAAAFPLATELWGRSIMVPGLDENYERVIVSPLDLGKDKGVPQIFYGHNIMPTTQGYQSVGYTKEIAGIVPSPGQLDQVFTIQNNTGNRFLFSPAQGQNWIYDGSVGTWKQASPFLEGVIDPDTLVTVALIQQQSYIFYSGIGAFVYDEFDTPPDLIQKTLIGLNIGAILGLVAANGYLIAWTSTEILWSSLVNPLDFTPSLITGAGSQSLGDAKGAILFCLPISGGFMAYCERNVVGCTYSGNINFPFICKEVPGSGGGMTPGSVSWEANAGYHYAWTSAGCQQLTLTQSASAYQEISDFLSGLLFEDFDEVALTFSQTYLTVPLFVTVTMVGNQYLVLSYGQSAGLYTHAIVIDINLARWGKLRITHVDCFQWNDPNNFNPITYDELLGHTYDQLAGLSYNDLLQLPFVPDTVRKTLAFMAADGTVSTVDFDLSEQTADGVIVIGKFQERRNKWLQHQRTDLECMNAGNNYNFYVIPTMDGKSLITPTPGVLLPPPQIALGKKLIVNNQSVRYAAKVSGQNISLLVTGAFNLVSVVMDYTVIGER